MTLTPRKKRQPLLKHIDMLDQVSIGMDRRTNPSAVRWTLCAVSLETMADMWNREPEAKGIPCFVALANCEALIFFPSPDKKYSCQVVGSIRVVQ